MLSNKSAHSEMGVANTKIKLKTLLNWSSNPIIFVAFLDQAIGSFFIKQSKCFFSGGWWEATLGILSSLPFSIFYFVVEPSDRRSSRAALWFVRSFFSG